MSTLWGFACDIRAHESSELCLIPCSLLAVKTVRNVKGGHKGHPWSPGASLACQLGRDLRTVTPPHVTIFEQSREGVRGYN